jgi:hypothetical protein
MDGRDLSGDEADRRGGLLVLVGATRSFLELVTGPCRVRTVILKLLLARTVRAMGDKWVSTGHVISKDALCDGCSGSPRTSKIQLDK